MLELFILLQSDIKRLYVLSVLIKFTDSPFCAHDSMHPSISKTHLMLLLTEEDLIIVFNLFLDEYFVPNNCVLPSQVYL